MAIQFTPNVGRILECNFGDYQRDAEGKPTGTNVDSRLPPEMIKNRLVVVLNGRINGNACIVVPLSTTKDEDKTRRGMHVEVPAAMIPALSYFTQEDRWAKCDLVQQVSKERLHRPRVQGRGSYEGSLSNEMVTAIQKAVIKSINATSLLKP